MSTPEFEPATRELCPDEACIGLIGPDGRCKVCGTVSRTVVSDPRLVGLAPAAEAEVDDDRDLCDDGTCIGVLGADGRCKVCGRAGSSAARANGRASRAPSAAEASPAPVAGLETPSAAKPDQATEESSEIDDFDRRELCPDGACVGLIGSDGRCKVCGTRREVAP